MTSTPPRVFVSSVITGFEAYRRAAREGILAAGAEPILVNEDFPSTPDSSRNACLDAVASSDAFALVVGERGGWKTPSGRFVIEEEYDEAVRRGIPLYVFLQNVDRDTETKAFVSRVSDYVHGTFRRTFDDPEELQAELQKALATLRPKGIRMKGPAISAALKARNDRSQEPTLRLVIASVRDEELFDPLDLLREDFQDQVIQVESAQPHPLFGLRKEKKVQNEGGSLIITQPDEQGSHGSRWQSMLTLALDGIITAQTSIGPRNASSFRGLTLSMTVQTKDLALAAQSLFQGVDGLLGLVDQFMRHRQLEYNVAVHNLGYHYIVDEDPRAGGGVAMRMSGDEPVVAFDNARAITRETLSRPEGEIERVVQLLKHRAK